MKQHVIAALALTALGATGLQAQASTTGAANVTIPQVLVISSVGDLNIDGSAFDFSASETSTASGTVDITSRANLGYTLNVTATDITLAGVATPLGFALIPQGGGPAQSLSGGATVTWSPSLARGSSTNTLSFEATADINLHDPGTYTGTITYTLIGN